LPLGRRRQWLCLDGDRVHTRRQKTGLWLIESRSGASRVRELGDMRSGDAGRSFDVCSTLRSAQKRGNIMSVQLVAGHDVDAVRAIAARALAESKGARASESWRRKLMALDRCARFSHEALRFFQNLQAQLGIPTSRPILLPLNIQPFWHRAHNPLVNYQST